MTGWSRVQLESSDSVVEGADKITIHYFGRSQVKGVKANTKRQSMDRLLRALLEIFSPGVNQGTDACSGRAGLCWLLPKRLLPLLVPAPTPSKRVRPPEGQPTQPERVRRRLCRDLPALAAHPPTPSRPHRSMPASMARASGRSIWVMCTCSGAPGLAAMCAASLRGAKRGARWEAVSESCCTLARCQMMMFGYHAPKSCAAATALWPPASLPPPPTHVARCSWRAFAMRPALAARAAVVAGRQPHRWRSSSLAFRASPRSSSCGGAGGRGLESVVQRGAL